MLTMGTPSRTERRLRPARPSQATVPRPSRRLVGQAGPKKLRRTLPRGLRPAGHLHAARVHLGQPTQGPGPDRGLHCHLPECVLRGQGDLPRPAIVPARVRGRTGARARGRRCNEGKFTSRPANRCCTHPSHGSCANIWGYRRDHQRIRNRSRWRSWTRLALYL